MTILIGAPSCTGKTLMAQRLLETYKIPYLSADHLKMGLYRANIGCGFTPEDDDARIEERLWPILKGIIEVSIENGQDIIIEGCYLFPQRLREFSAEYRKQIIPVFMGFSAAYIQRKYHSGILAHNSVMEQRGEETRSAEWFIAANQQWRQLCAESNVPCFEIDGDYQSETAKIYAWIDGKMRERVQP